MCRDWAHSYAHARRAWQAYLCVWGYTSHYGGYRRVCGGCLPVTLDYLRLMRMVDSDLCRPWVVRVEKRSQMSERGTRGVPVHPAPSRFSHVPNARTGDEGSQPKRARLSQDAEPT